MRLIVKYPRLVRLNCLQGQHRLLAFQKRYGHCYLSTSPSQQEPSKAQNGADPKDVDHIGQYEEAGGMSRRLAQMTDESLEYGGRSAEKAVEEAGFSEELKRRLEERIKDSKFRSDHPAAFTQLNLPSNVGQGTRDVATAQPWTGTEIVEDTALRMLTDAHKSLRTTGARRIPTPRGPSMTVDMRMKKAVQNSHGQRLANARDRTSAYALSQDPNLSDHEKEQMRKQLKERFTPGARPMPGTVQGLAALANERIEDAIARGQFKNIPRGKGKNIERDYTASSPFLDTTEYFMNKIIQKQEIVPPWIEKQQELVRAAAVFRNRLRADWKRHAARMIASKGGSLEAQINRAKAYAAAEAAIDPRRPKIKDANEIDNAGRMSQFAITASSASPPISQTANISNESKPIFDQDSGLPNSRTDLQPTNNNEETTPNTIASPAPPSPSSPRTPFRDPAWQALEHAYLSLAITSLNNLTRSYNLQAPKLAEKPYFSLARELVTCYADIAPLLPDEILARATAPKTSNPEGRDATGKGGVLGRLSGGGVGGAIVVESRRPHYGFRQFWKEFWGF